MKSDYDNRAIKFPFWDITSSTKIVSAAKAVSRQLGKI